MRLGDGAAYALSPDQKWVIAGSVRSPMDSTLLPTGAGETRKLSHGAVTLVRARWMPDEKAIAFVGMDEFGTAGVFVQDFVVGKDTRNSRKKLAGFDQDLFLETFGISSDGQSRAHCAL